MGQHITHSLCVPLLPEFRYGDFPVFLDEAVGLKPLKILRFTNYEETSFLILEKYYNGAKISRLLVFNYLKTIVTLKNFNTNIYS